MQPEVCAPVPWFEDYHLRTENPAERLTLAGELGAA